MSLSSTEFSADADRVAGRTSLAHERHIAEGVRSLYCSWCGTWPPEDEPLTLRMAAIAVVMAQEKLRNAINGVGHPGEDHDDVLHNVACACTTILGDVEVREVTSDCAACGGSQYGAEDTLNRAYGDLRAALGLPVRPWESREG